METGIKDTKKTFSKMKDIQIELEDIYSRFANFERTLKQHEQDLASFYAKLQSMDRRIGQGGKR